jgi:peptide/nickel transport system substrate-binding protein
MTGKCFDRPELFELRQLWAGLLALLVVLLVGSGGCSGCRGSGQGDGRGSGSGSGAATRSKDPSKLVIAISTEPPGLVPMIHPDQWGHRIAMHNVLETLVAFDPKPPHRLRGELAASWKVSDDGKTYDFTLREGVRWHDGKPLRVADVVFTFDRVLDPKVRAVSSRGTIEPFISRYQAVGARGFRIICKRRSPYFLKALADLPILPAHRMSDGDLNVHPLLRRPVGTGPYRFENWVSGRRIVLHRAPRYWGPKPSIEQLIFRVVRSPELALQLARRGEVDLLPRIHGAQWAQRVIKDKRLLARLRPIHHVTPGTAFVLLNHRRALFADKRVRRALALLLDVKTIVTQIMHGQAKRIASLIWIDDPEHDPSIKPVPFDPAAAAKLLDAAGWTDSDGDGVRDRGGKAFRFTFLLIASSKSTRRWSTVYQQQLKKAGIAMRIVPIEWTAYLAKIRAHDFDMGTLGMAIAGPYTDLYLQLHSSQIADGQNYSAFSSKTVDALLEAIRTELDDGKRKALSHRLQRLLADAMPVIPLFTLTEPGLVSRKVQGVYRSPMWYQLRDWRVSPQAKGQ